MAGNVYVFNTTSASVTLILNNTLVSTTLNGVTQSGNYAPTSVSLLRNPASNSGTNEFGTDNKLVASFGAGFGAQTFSININPTAIPLASDLQLYIFFDEAVLEFNGNGTNEAGQTQTFRGRATSSKKVQQLSKSDHPPR